MITYMGLLSKDGQGLLLEAQFDTLGALRNLASYGQLVKSIEPGTAPHSTTQPSVESSARASSANRPLQGMPHSAQAGQGGGIAAANGILAPATAGSVDAPATPTGHDLYDWFGSFYNSVMPGPNFTISTSMVWTFYRFFPNGYVYEGMPAGTDPAAINCPAVVKGGKCKQYSISGNTLTIAGEKRHTFARDGSGIKIDGTTNNRVRRADKPMNGRWETSSGGGLLTTVTLSQHMLTLRPDGTFSIDGSTGVSSPNVAAYGSSANGGHYKTSGYTIEMDYANGRVVRQSFLLPYPDNNVFLIGDSMYFVPKK